MSLQVRPYQEADRDAYAYVRSMVYRGGDPVGPDEKLLREDCHASVVERDGTIVGSCLALDMTCTRGTQGTIRCAGVASVGVVPEARDSGAGAALMRGVLPQYRELGFSIASLYPFRATYYRQFGYEVCGRRYEVGVPQRAMPRIKAELHARPIRSEDFGQLHPCFEAFARRYSGMSLRNGLQWWRQLGGDRPFQVYAFGDPIEAYVALRLNGDFWEEQEVREVIFTTDRGYRAILGFLAGVYANKTKILWDEPGDSPFVAQYLDHGIDVKLDNNIMFRLIDVQRALAALQPLNGASGEFTFGVHDPELSENRGPWRVAYGADGVSVERFDGNPDLEFGIRAFTHAYLGEPSLASVVEQGRAVVRSAGAVEAASRLLPFQRTHCSDRF